MNSSTVMPRIHAFELEDQRWFPRLLRDYATDFLRFMIDLGDSYAPAAPLINDAFRRSGADRIVDLGSGGGGPWLRLHGKLGAQDQPVRVLLTDLYPNDEAARHLRRVVGDSIAYHPATVDALHVPAELTGFRTVFTALHHFRPEQVRRLLEDAARAGQGIGAFEFSERSVRGLLLILLSPLFVLLATPFIRPFRWSRLLLTYPLPVIPLVVLFDGVVSTLRSYRVSELRQIADSVGVEGYAWEVGAVKGAAPIPVIYVVGVPGGG